MGWMGRWECWEGGWDRESRGTSFVKLLQLLDVSEGTGQLITVVGMYVLMFQFITCTDGSS